MDYNASCEVEAGKTYDFRSEEDHIQILFGILPNDNYELTPCMVTIHNHQKKGVRTLLSILPLSGSLDYTSYTLKTGIEIAQMRGWTITSR